MVHAWPKKTDILINRGHWDTDTHSGRCHVKTETIELVCPQAKEFQRWPTHHPDARRHRPGGAHLPHLHLEALAPSRTVREYISVDSTTWSVVLYYSGSGPRVSRMLPWHCSKRKRTGSQRVSEGPPCTFFCLWVDSCWDLQKGIESARKRPLLYKKEVAPAWALGPRSLDSAHNQRSWGQQSLSLPVAIANVSPWDMKV